MIWLCCPKCVESFFENVKFQNENMCDLILFCRYLICKFIFSTWMSAVDRIRCQRLIPFYVTTCEALLKLIIIDFALLTRFFLILVLESSMFISNSIEITFIELLNWPHWVRLDYRCWRFEWLFQVDWQIQHYQCLKHFGLSRNFTTATEKLSALTTQ